MWTAFESRFWLFWITNTIRNVTMVVPVLMTSCQVSENPKMGPVTAHTTITNTAMSRATGDPSALMQPSTALLNVDFIAADSIVPRTTRNRYAHRLRVSGFIANRRAGETARSGSG